MSVIVGRDDAGSPGAFDRDGGLGTSWRSDPEAIGRSPTT